LKELRDKNGSDRLIYFDNAATTRTDERVLEAMLPFFSENYGNPNGMYSLGFAAKKAVRDAREKVAALIGAEPDEIVFTSGGTESNNTCIQGFCQDGLLVSEIEHASVLNTAADCRKRGIETDIIPVNRKGITDISILDEKLVPKRNGSRSLVSVMFVNNELGTEQPIESIAALAHERGWLFHTDAVQAVGHKKFNVKKMGIDFLSAGAHKLYGPKGVGFLYIRRGIKLNPLILGGGQEDGRRSGTVNVPGTVGMGEACDLACRELDSYISKENEVARVLKEGLLRIPRTHINGEGNRIINISFEGVSASSLMLRLDMENICVNTGSACTRGGTEQSHVLKAIGLSGEASGSSIRFSTGKYNTVAEAERTVRVTQVLVEELRSLLV